MPYYAFKDHLSQSANDSKASTPLLIHKDSIGHFVYRLRAAHPGQCLIRALAPDWDIESGFPPGT